MKTALVHDHMLEFGGAERVFVELATIFPDADLYLAAYDKKIVKDRCPELQTRNIRTAWASRIPFYHKLYSPLRFLTPLIWKSFDLSSYDVVISSSGWFMSKGITTKHKRPNALEQTDISKTTNRSHEEADIKRKEEDQKKVKHQIEEDYSSGTKHISYIHHPPSYLYGYQTAVEWQKYLPVRIYAVIINHFLRIYDYEASQRPDVLVANSEETKKRIRKFYRRDADVIYPPVNIPKHEPPYDMYIKPTKHIGSVKNSQSTKYESSKNSHQIKHESSKKSIATESPTHNTEKKKRGGDDETTQETASHYYITVSRLAYKKHVDLLIRAANKFSFRLKIVGTGRDKEYLESIAGPTVDILGYVRDEEFEKLFQEAYAFLNASQEEEFGIAPVEAMGRGLPVIAYKSGGLMETVKDGRNGFLFEKLTTKSLHEKIMKVEGLSERDYVLMRKRARLESQKYTSEIFKKKMKSKVTNIMKS